MLNAEFLLDTIKGLEGLEIGLFLAENQSIQGTLLSVQEDHLIVKVNENVIYFPITQIKALSKNAKESSVINKGFSNTSLNRFKLEEILKTMYLQWITVNSFGNKSFSGVLSNVYEDYIVLINGENQYYILKSQITSILNEQIDENQIINLEANGIANTALTNLPTSNLTSEDGQLTEEQKKAISDAIKEKVKQLFPMTNEDEQQDTTSDMNIDDLTATITQENQLEESSPSQNEETLQDERLAQITATSKNILQEPPSKLEATLQNIENNPTKQQENTLAISSKNSKKTQKRPFFHEVKFNSPIQECTWEDMTMESHSPSKEKEQTELFYEDQELKKTEMSLIENTVKIAEKEDFEIKNLLEPSEEIQQLSEDVYEIQPVSGKIIAAQQIDDAEEIFEEIMEPIECTSSSEESEFIHEPVKMLMEDNKRLLKYQYYALMKFAERMYHIENQYRAIMKHAEKMYLQLKERSYY